MDRRQILRAKELPMIGQIGLFAMMLDYLGEKEASDRIINSINFIR